MRDFKDHDAVRRFCREHRELRDLLHPRRRHDLIFPAALGRTRLARVSRIASPSCRTRDWLLIQHLKFERRLESWQIQSGAITRAVRFALEQSADVDTTRIVVPHSKLQLKTPSAPEPRWRLVT